MKIRKVLMSAVLAASMLFTGCAESSGATKPEEISGFEGNVSDVSPKSGDLIATIEIESFGTIKALLYPEAAPIGVENFQKLADAGYYKGLKIHRVMKEFMFQGGSANGDGTGGEAMVNNGSFDIETTQNMRHFYGALCYANAAGSNSTQFYIVNDNRSQNLDKFNFDDYESVIKQYKNYAEQFKKNGNSNGVANCNFQINYYQTTLNWVRGASDAIKSKYLEKGGTPSLDGNYTVFGQVYEGFDVIDSISSVEVELNSSNEKSKPVQDIIIKNITVSVYE